MDLSFVQAERLADRHAGDTKSLACVVEVFADGEEVGRLVVLYSEPAVRWVDYWEPPEALADFELHNQYVVDRREQEGGE